MADIELDNFDVGWYATVHQVRNKFRANPSQPEIDADADLDDDQINDLILEAQAVVDGALIKIYSSTFPIDFEDPTEGIPNTIPPLVNKITLNLAAAYVLDAIYVGNSEESTPRATVFEKRAMKWLMMIKDGDIDLIGADDTLIPPDFSGLAAGGESNTEASEQIMPLMDEPYPDFGDIIP